MTEETMGNGQEKEFYERIYEISLLKVFMELEQDGIPLSKEQELLVTKLKLKYGVDTIADIGDSFFEPDDNKEVSQMRM